MLKVISILAVLSQAVWVAHSHAQASPPPVETSESCRSGLHEYRISRQGVTKGLLRVQISFDAGFCRIDVREWLEDTHYCHHTYRREAWKEGELTDYLSLTKGWCGLLAKFHDPSACRWSADGSPIEVTAERDGDRLSVRRAARSEDYPTGVATMTFLGPQYPFAGGTLALIDPFRGEIAEIEITGIDDGAPGTTAYDVAGDRLSTLVYDSEQMLSRLVFDGGIGGDVTYDLLSSDADQPLPEEPECEAVFAPMQFR